MSNSSTKLQLRQWLLIIVLLYPAWLLLESTHELGHVLHAWLAGASVLYIDVPLLGFSRTEVVHNSHPQFIAWGGPLWGSLLPLAAWAIAPRRWRASNYLQLFAGLCLIANGVYLSVGWIEKAGDAADLMKHGAPLWSLLAAGGSMVTAGLWLWHSLGRRRA